ncbi:MAG TPA: bifunctional molybdenum cofactor biosynthesis protein MoaC/MoaB [bacterium]|jgi:molybdenum cofactor biosynthesis protein MoaC
MHDITRKTNTLRISTAEATVHMRPETIERIQRKDIPKGDVLEVARVAGIQAAKNCSQLIPLVHPVPVEFVGILFAIGEKEIVVTATVKAIARTGLEMEALTATSTAALTIYDMIRVFDDTLEIDRIRLVIKKGSRFDYRESFAKPLRAAVLVVSDAIAAGNKEDLAGKLIADRLRGEGLRVEDYKVVACDPLAIAPALVSYADKMSLDLVLTSGGTGFGPRDHTPEATTTVIEREIPGIPEALRAYGQERAPHSMLTRGKSGIRGHTIIINLPGSKKGVAEALDALFPGLLHSFKILWGGAHPEKKARPETAG